jgi:hypothetical protein
LVEHLPSKHKALNSNLDTAPKQKTRTKQQNNTTTTNPKQNIPCKDTKGSLVRKRECKEE